MDAMEGATIFKLFDNELWALVAVHAENDFAREVGMVIVHLCQQVLDRLGCFALGTEQSRVDPSRFGRWFFLPLL